MIEFTTYKNRPAVSIKTSTIKGVFLYDDGAKLTSLTNLKNGKELLAVKDDNTYKVLEYNGNYVDSECSGFDDMFPTIDPFTVSNGEYENVTYPDHGESCRLPHKVSVINNEIVFTAKSKLFNITYEKRVKADNDSLVLNYEITNNGNTPFQYLWAGHIILQGDDNVKLLTPYESNAPTEVMFAPNGVDATILPKDRLIGYEKGKGYAYKFYYLEPISEGYFGLRYGDGSTLSFTYDKTILPYLGVWLNNGEFQNLYSIAPEPANIPFDSPEKAEKRGYRAFIKPNNSFKLQIKISLKDN